MLFIASTVAIGQSKYPNVQIFESTGLNYPVCEPSISISKTEPNVMVAGAVLKYVYRSEDGGLTWASKKMRSRHGVYGDPCIVSDLKGHFHYFHLSDPTGLGWGSPWILDRIVCQTSKSSGKRWSRGSSIGQLMTKVGWSKVDTVIRYFGVGDLSAINSQADYR